MANARGLEAKALFALIQALDQRVVDTSTISYGLQTQDPYVQRHVMDIIMELLNLWSINNDPGLYAHFPNHPLRSVYEQASRMLAALDYDPDRQETSEIPAV